MWLDRAGLPASAAAEGPAEGPAAGPLVVVVLLLLLLLLPSLPGPGSGGAGRAGRDSETTPSRNKSMAWERRSYLGLADKCVFGLDEAVEMTNKGLCMS